MEALAAGAAPILGRSLSRREQDDFTKYLTLLLKWQRAHRLIGSAEPMWIVEHLFLDSLLFLKLLPASVRALADVGSGAGLPGLPIKIVRPEVQIALIESRRRRAMFLTTAIREIALTGARVLEGRVERLIQEHRGSFDAVVMRCAGDLEEMIPLAAGLLPDHGIVIASGPPRPKLISTVEWITVPGIKTGSTRLFGVYRKPVSLKPLKRS
jgi:16S rRNA (guanine527-N7)-methyltransferase